MSRKKWRSVMIVGILAALTAALISSATAHPGSWSTPALPAARASSDAPPSADSASVPVLPQFYLPMATLITLALPPRSLVGSQSQEETNPLSSNRSKVT